MNCIPVIDVFAGPGGLCEGFSRYSADGGRSNPFDVALSVEFDAFAWGTLRRRALYRQAFLEATRSEQHEAAFLDYAARVNRARSGKGRPKEEALGEKELVSLEEHFRKSSNPMLFPDGISDKTGTHPLDITKRKTHNLIAEAVARAKSVSEHWVLIGGPPCQAYSLSGRSRMQGIDPKKFLKDERHRLYREYVRILAKHKPSIFVMENVKGILSSPDPESKDKLIFDVIRKVVSCPNGGKPEYRLFSLETGKEVNDSREFLVRAEKHGIPQSRHRVIILGIREDLVPVDGKVSHLSQVLRADWPTAEDAIGDLPRLRSMISLRKQGNPKELSPELFRTLSWKSSIEKAHSMLQKGMPPEESRRLSRSIAALSDHLDPFCDHISTAASGSDFMRTNADWFRTPPNGLVLNHMTREHKPSDLLRYLFISTGAERTGTSPKLADLAKAGLEPLHRSAKDQSGHEDRFKTHPRNGTPKTIVSHSGKDGHANIHYDPSQCRSFTVREAARIQTFPDDYFFEGPKTEQFKQVGNAVPALLARQIADVVFKILE